MNFSYRCAIGSRMNGDKIKIADDTIKSIHFPFYILKEGYLPMLSSTSLLMASVAAFI